MPPKRTLNRSQEPNQIARICGTINNWTPECYAHLVNLGPDGEGYFSYLVIGKEVAPGTGTPHLQFFAIFDKKKTRKSFEAKLKLPNGAIPYIEATKGTSQQAADYCKKDGDVHEWGDCPDTPGNAGGNAEKERWDGISDAADSCDTCEDFFEWCELNLGAKEFVTKMKMLENYYNLKSKKKVANIIDDLSCEWIMGPPGTGKSHTARDENPIMYVKAPTGKWFDGYNNEPVVLFDDLDHNSSRDVVGLIKQLADKYAVVVEVKGGSIKIRPRKVIVTSNYSIAALFPELTACAAISRRFTVRRLTTVYKPPAPGPVLDVADSPVEIVAQAEAQNDYHGAY